MKLQENPPLPQAPDTGYLRELVARLTVIFRGYAQQINAVSEGRIQAVTNAMTAAPTSGTWQQGDFVRNSAPAELGSAGSKYVVYGFQCIAAGSPGTWVQTRFLTGN